MDEKDSMMGEHTDFQKQKAKLELDLSDLTSELDGESSQKVTQVQRRSVHDYIGSSAL